MKANPEKFQAIAVGEKTKVEDITFANGLDPDHARQNVVPHLDPNCFDTMNLIILLPERLF